MFKYKLPKYLQIINKVFFNLNLNKDMKKIILGLSAIILVACSSPLDENGSRLCPSDDFEFKPSDLKVEKIIEKNGSFTFKELNTNEKISFDSIGIKISAELSEEVDWELTISSKTSLSRKIYKSRSNNVEVYWYGNSDRLPFFGNEECEITFRILCNPIVKIPFEVEGKANFKKTHPNFGFLVRDFEGNGMYPINNGSVNDVGNGWFDASVTFSYETDEPSPMGGRYLRMYKKQDDIGWYLGGHSFPINTVGKKFQSFFPTNDPEKIYLNFFLRADKYPNANTEIGLKNPTLGAHIVSGNVNWTGWKLISRSFSELKITSGQHSGKSIPATAVYTLDNMILQLGSNPKETNELQYDYDFIFISFGSPLAN